MNRRRATQRVPGPIAAARRRYGGSLAHGASLGPAYMRERLLTSQQCGLGLPQQNLAGLRLGSNTAQGFADVQAR